MFLLCSDHSTHSVVNLSNHHMNYPNQSQPETHRTDTSLLMENDFPYYLPDEILQHLDTFCQEVQVPLCLSPSPQPPSLVTTPSNDISGGVLHDLVMEEANMAVGFDGESIFPTMPTWVLLGQLVFDCSGCSLLREILHGNDFCTMKLMIHGVPGFFYHAILDVANTATGFTQQYFADLRGHSGGSVKQFLMEYGLSRQQEGQIVMSDSMNQFYDVLCVGMKTPVFSNNAGGITAGHRPDDTNRPWIHQDAGVYQTQTGMNSSSPIQEPEFQAIALRKTGIAAQRERAEALTLEEISTLFHLPIAKASIRLQLCTTALKKACRRHGVKRWPHRKVQSVEQKIIKLQKALKTQTGTEAAMTLAEIARNTEVRDRACEGFVGKVRRLEECVLDKKAKLRCQSGTDAEITLIEISQLKEKVKRVKSRMGRKGKIIKEKD